MTSLRDFLRLLYFDANKGEGGKLIRFTILFFKETVFVGYYFPKAISIEKVGIPFPKIDTNLPWTEKKLICKVEPYWLIEILS